MIIHIDRSRLVARQDCPQLRYWNYHYKGKGLQPRTAAPALGYGIALHAGFARILQGFPPGIVVDEVAMAYGTELHKQYLAEGMSAADATFFACEQSWLMAGQLLGWAKYRLPHILDEYDVVSIEDEFVIPFDDARQLVAMLRLDAMLRRKADGLHFILDFKSLSNVSTDWMVHHERSVQTMFYTLALERLLEEYVGGILYEGLVKGYSRIETAASSPWKGKLLQQSPICYGWGNGFEIRPGYTATKGYKKVALFEQPGIDILAYMELHGLDKELFVSIPPVKPTPRELERFRRSTLLAETRFAQKVAMTEAAMERDPEVGKAVMELEFERSLERCWKYGTRNGCPFVHLCHQGMDPDENDLFVAREPHHSSENHNGEEE